MIESGVKTLASSADPSSQHLDGVGTLLEWAAREGGSTRRLAERSIIGRRSKEKASEGGQCGE